MPYKAKPRFVFGMIRIWAMVASTTVVAATPYVASYSELENRMAKGLQIEVVCVQLHTPRRHIFYFFYYANDDVCSVDYTIR